MGAIGPVSLLMTCLFLAPSVQCQDQFLIFDIKGDVSSNQVLKVFSGFNNVTYIFQVILAQRYIVVMPKVAQSEFADLSFPSAEVTSFVAERSDDFYASFGASKENMDAQDLHGNDLMMVEVEFTMQELPMAEYTELLLKMGNHLQTIKRDYAVHGYHLLGHMPVRLICFNYVAGQVARGMMMLTENPHYFRVKTSPVLRVL